MSTNLMWLPALFGLQAQCGLRTTPVISTKHLYFNVTYQAPYPGADPRLLAWAPIPGSQPRI